ncbi:response regulator [Planosporangium thailandense]|uniref:Response regulator n=1 Tax=Planosporangium thailandense TaxID=765197 RepID=A0ABX0Y2W8_9ACTN|nr:response regulator [Planosporangium thailandense]NJC71765.1 response regulator [Planosporangium thailandense]
MLALVIDDSRAIRMILGRILANLGFEVREAGNGKEALDVLAAAETVPRVALVDWNMPEMNGLEFVGAVREDPKYRSMALMMVTTESEQSQIVRALAAGAHEYVIKPFTPDAIEEKLALLGVLTNGAAQ